MKIPNPDDYIGKNVIVHFIDGDTMKGKFIGYSYDYDDNGDEFLEIDVDSPSGIGYSFTEGEAVRIEVV